MRLDIGLWLGSALLVLIGAALRAWPRRRSERRPARFWGLWAPLALVCLGLACLAAGLVWRTRAVGGWPGGASADGLTALAAGALTLLAWLLVKDALAARAGEDALSRSRALPEALAMFGAGLLLLVSGGAAWRSPALGLSAPATSWLFGVRVLAASLGLGAWLPALADAVWSLRPGIGSQDRETGAPAPGPDAMQAGYPWLTAAWLLGAAWSLARAAALWGGLPAEAWLTAAWLLGGIYLIAVRELARPPQWALLLLTACGTAAALVQAWQTPLLLP